MSEKWSFWFGPDTEDRRIAYAEDFRPEYQANGDELQRRIAAVEIAYFAAGGTPLPGGYASGWRPRTVNEATTNAGKLSNHLVGNAGDVRDNPDGDFAWWCLRNPGVLTQHGLWMEHPVATVVRSWKTAKKQGREPTPWCHLQRVAPASGTRAYFPDKAAVKEWDEFEAAGGKIDMSYAAWWDLHAETPAPAGTGKS